MDAASDLITYMRVDNSFPVSTIHYRTGSPKVKKSILGVLIGIAPLKSHLTVGKKVAKNPASQYMRQQ
jgi:hypothetical protein